MKCTVYSWRDLRHLVSQSVWKETLKAPWTDLKPFSCRKIILKVCRFLKLGFCGSARPGRVSASWQRTWRKRTPSGGSAGRPAGSAAVEVQMLLPAGRSLYQTTTPSGAKMSLRNLPALLLSNTSRKLCESSQKYFQQISGGCGSSDFRRDSVWWRL